MTLNELYAFAEQQNHDVIPYDLGPRAAISIQMGGRCYIGIDPLKLTSTADEKTKLGHELGHCEEGAFYNQYSPFDVKQKHENRANIWEIKKLIPKDELNSIVAAGYTQPWELAEYFGVTEDLMRMAMCYYRYGTLDYRQYFN